MIKRAMILAAGFGTRLGAMTQVTPKPLICVGQQPILFRILDALALRGFEEVVINTHYLADQVHQAVALWKEESESNMTIHISHEVELLEIGGGMRYAQKFLKNEPFVVINGDIVWQETRHPLLDNLMNAFDKDEMDALMVMSPLENVAQFRERGDVVMGTDRLVKFPTENDTPNYVYAGIQVIHPRMLDILPEGRSALRPAWKNAEENEALYGYYFDGEWTDMGTPEGLEIAQDIVRKTKDDSKAQSTKENVA